MEAHLAGPPTSPRAESPTEPAIPTAVQMHAASLRAQLADLLFGLARREGRGLDESSEHLLRTSAILHRWSQPLDMCIAGALHDAYATDVHVASERVVERRREIEAAVGEKAERLAYAFGAIPREEFLDVLRRQRGVPDEPVSFSSQSPEGAQVLVPDTVSALLVLHMAREIAHEWRPGDLWVGRVLRWGVLLRGKRERVPRIATISAAPTMEEERKAGQLYERALAMMANRTGSPRFLLEEAATTCPALPEPHAWCAYLAACEGDRVLTHHRSASARTLLEIWGAPWDKRLSYDEWALFTRVLEAVAVSGRDHPAHLPPPDPSDLHDFVFRVCELYFDGAFKPR
jgi:hypothetical protein